METPIFFLLSEGNVEYKISQISKNYSDLTHTLFYPLASAIIFLFLVPYLNQANEWFLKQSIKKRADFKKLQCVEKIERDRDIAIAEDEMQKAIQNARESKEHNNYISELKATIEESNKTLNEERIRNNEDMKLLQDQNAVLVKDISELRNNANNEIIKLRDNIYEKEAEKHSIKSSKESEIYSLNERIDSLKRFLNETTSALKVQRELRFNKPKDGNCNLLNFKNGEKIIEFDTDSPYPKYVDYNTKRSLAIVDVENKIKSNDYSIVPSPLSDIEFKNLLNLVHINDIEFQKGLGNS